MDMWLDTLDGLEEAQKAFYVKVTVDGAEKFVLQTLPEGLTLEDTSGLRSALQATRQELSAAKAAAKAFDGLDPEAARAALATAQKAGEADETARQQYEAKLAAERERAAAALQERDTYMLDSVRAAAIAKAGANPLLADPFLRARMKIVEENGQKVVVATDEAGNPLVTKRPGEAGWMSPDELVDTLRGDPKTYGGLFPAKTADGPGGGPVGEDPTGGAKNPWAKDTWNLTEQMAMERDNPGQAEQMRAAAGE